jgi:hypothetical protein
MDKRPDNFETNGAFNAQWVRDHRLFDELVQLVHLIPEEYRGPFLRFQILQLSDDSYSGGYFAAMARTCQRRYLDRMPDRRENSDRLCTIVSTIHVDCLNHIHRSGATAQGEQVLSELPEALIKEVLDQCHSFPT